jgi:muramidase (phage lysozyme)
VSSSRTGDPCTDIILDFIAGGTPDNKGGESGGNYNAVIGNAKSKQDLGAWTLGEIKRSLMPALLAKGEPSTAVGRYQIIKRTLEGLQGPAGIGDDEHFTPLVQDHLAVQLLSGRGYRAWYKGQLDDVTFAHGLSCEWASLPDPQHGGKSHYDGVGPNHAGVGLPAVYAMLARARAAIGIGNAGAAEPAATPTAAPAPAPEAEPQASAPEPVVEPLAPEPVSLGHQKALAGGLMPQLAVVMDWASNNALPLGVLLALVGIAVALIVWLVPHGGRE